MYVVWHLWICGYNSFTYSFSVLGNSRILLHNEHVAHNQTQGGKNKKKNFKITVVYVFSLAIFYLLCKTTKGMVAKIPVKRL